MSSRPSSRLVLLLVSSLSLLAGGCLDVREAAEEEAEPCAACHGDATREGDALMKAAPPGNLDGETDVSAVGVGAHQIHLDPGGRAAPVACEACHLVPDETYAPGHVDTGLPAEVTFGDAALSEDPAYDAEAGSCADVYCHGSDAPVWLEPRSANDRCGTCHALPPPAPHPAFDDCSQCHGTVIDADNEFIAPELHVNGEVDLGELACNTCHGFPPSRPHPQRDDCSRCHGTVIDADGEFVAPELHMNGDVNVSDLPCNACHGAGEFGAPPPDLTGSDLVSSRGVGAHAAHLEGSYSHEPVACEQCHVVPEAVDATGHIDESPPADIQFGSLAEFDGATPTYDSSDHTCTDSYCHGDATPVWTEPRDSDAACGSCHGLPPAPPHVQDAQCGKCHSAVIDLRGDFVDASLHVNGTLNLDDLGCSSCHGTGSEGAPPPDLSGSTDPSSPGVGAHTLHLNPSDTHAAIACEECHIKPVDIDEAGHQDGSPVELTFGTLATTGGADPQYSFTANTCTDSYCHGDATPNWVAPASDACGTCHALPPPAPHPDRTDCFVCHGEVIDSAGAFTAPERHVDGTLDVQLACDSCHGADATGAPPPDLAGNTLATEPGVGAHAVHLGGGDFRAVACGECHVVPTAVGDVGHVDDWGRAEVQMSGVAATESSAPSWDPSSLTCSDSWCHGPRGASATSPVWTEQPNLGCSDCHGFPPPPPHPPIAECSQCHTTVDDSLAIIQPDQHVNGVVDVELSCNSCHGSATSNAPPVDLAGNTDVTAPGVGAHRRHLAPQSYFRPVPCEECHVVPVDVDDPGHVDDWGTAEVQLSGAAVAEASAATWDSGTLTCADAWCHGPRLTSTSPVWTESTGGLSCAGGCHQYPPADHDPSFTDCSTCHSSGGLDNTAAHVNGVVDFN